MDAILNVGAFIDDEEDEDFEDALLLHILHDEEQLGNRAILYGRFSLNNMSDIECKNLFRFAKNDIPRLARALDLPDIFQIENVTSVSGIDGLCMLLRRFTYPNRLSDLEPLFGFSGSILSQVCTYTLNIISENKGHILVDLGNVPHLNYEKLSEYSHAIRNMGCPLDNCWGFIDGTVRPICRPSINQQLYYSGHKRLHCLKFQSVLCPDGIIISLKGAFEGRRHDAGILRESGLYEELEQNVTFPNHRFCLYGDQAYGLRELLLRPYTEHEIRGNQQRQQFNTSMRGLRVAVEWGFGKVIQNFAFLDFKKNQKILLQEIGKMYSIGVLLSNCHTCLYGGEIPSYFGIDPPSLEEYLGANN
ncbi:uncharacterized protein [Diabrotica undecimpunctata]|uniref:uncharacterized protein n=1 Tax=Diabrotica undecimpunctata TaxID=50387 RepID=UPI003B63E3C9